MKIKKENLKLIAVLIIAGVFLSFNLIQAVTRIMVPQGGTGHGYFESGAYLVGNGSGALATSTGTGGTESDPIWIASSTDYFDFDSWYSTTSATQLINLAYVDQDVKNGSSPTFLTPTISGLVWDGHTLASTTDIYALGTITTGIWNGTSIADAYIDNNITITNLSGTNTGDQNLSGYMENTDIDTFAELQSWAVGYTDNDTTYTSSDFTHDDLTGFVANEHLDWTGDLGATNIHSGNYTDNDTTYPYAVNSVGSNNQVWKSDGSGIGGWGTDETGAGGSGSMTTIKEDDSQVGGADIVTLDFLGADFNLTETPDTEINITINDGGIDHDSLLNFVANEHLDWTQNVGTINAGNYTDNNTTYTSSDFTHDDLTGFVANEHLDWTGDLGATNIHAGNYTDTNTTYTSSDFTHDDLTGFVANEHLDWTQNVGTINAGNYTDTNTQLSGENVDDYVNLLLKDADSVNTRITLTYDDANNAFDFVVDDMNDDVPDAGDFGAGTDLDSNGAVAWGNLAEGELTDSSIIGADIKADTITHADIIDSDQADTKCIWFEDPTADDDFKSIWSNKTANNFLLTEIWAESDQTVSFDLQIDDGSPADVNGTDIAPAAGEAEDTSLSGDTTLAAGEELDLIITSVSGTPTWVSICWTGNWVD